MSELKGQSSQYVYANANLGLVVNLKGNEADVLLRGEKGKSLLDNVFFASSAIKLASNHVLRASNGLIWKPKQRGLSFVNHYVEIPHYNAFYLSQYTIEFWVKVDAWITTYLFARGTNSLTFTYAGMVTTAGIRLFVGSNNVLIPIASMVSGWNHVALSYQSPDIKSYINGNLSATGTRTSALTQGVMQFIIGGKLGSSGFEGSMDDVRLWNYARSQSEIQERMNHELKGDESGLVGYWKFNEGFGTTAYDSSPNGYHGTINGATYLTEL